MYRPRRSREIRYLILPDLGVDIGRQRWLFGGAFSTATASGRKLIPARRDGRH